MSCFIIALHTIRVFIFKGLNFRGLNRRDNFEGLYFRGILDGFYRLVLCECYIGACML